MSSEVLFYSGILLLSVFISSISQVMLKKASLRKYDNFWQEYLNPLVLGAYVIFFGTTFLSIFAYKVIPLSLGPALEATSYIYITFFGVVVFKEKLTKKKVFSLILIVAGILIYSFV